MTIPHVTIPVMVFLLPIHLRISIMVTQKYDYSSNYYSCYGIPQMTIPAMVFLLPLNLRNISFLYGICFPSPFEEYILYVNLKYLRIICVFIYLLCMVIQYTL